MGGGSSNSDEDMITGINVTPLVDITLVLLIIFMVTATYIVKETIEVDLPRAAHGGETTGKTLAVVLTAEGDIYLDGAKLTEQELKERVAADVQGDNEVRAVISADQQARHGQVVHVIDIIKGLGVAKFAINIEKEAEPTPQ